MSRSSRRRLLAFTLIELLVVIAIIAVLATILVPVGQNMIKSGRSAQAFLPEFFYDPVVKKGRQHLWGCFGVNPAMVARGPVSSYPTVADWKARGAATGQPPALVSNPSKKVLACSSTARDKSKFDSSWVVDNSWETQGSSASTRPDARHGGKTLALFAEGGIERLDTDNMDRAEREKYFARDP